VTDVPSKPVLNRGGYIPAPDGADTMKVDLSHCKVLTDWDPDHPMVALNAALADKTTEWIIPRALVEACGPGALAQLNAATPRGDPTSGKGLPNVPEAEHLLPESIRQELAEVTDDAGFITSGRAAERARGETP
jgi:hypothetical protein